MSNKNEIDRVEEWVRSRRLLGLHFPGDGCSSVEEYKNYKALMKVDLAQYKPTITFTKDGEVVETLTPLAKALVLFIQHSTCAGARMAIWDTKLIGNTAWLLAVHPQIEKAMVRTACETNEKDKWPIGEYFYHHGVNDPCPFVGYPSSLGANKDLRKILLGL